MVTWEIPVRLPLINYVPGNHTPGIANVVDGTVLDDYYVLAPPGFAKATNDLNGSSDRVNLVEMIMWSINNALRNPPIPFEDTRLTCVAWLLNDGRLTFAFGGTDPQHLDPA